MMSGFTKLRMTEFTQTRVKRHESENGGEFLPHRPKWLMQVALSVALVSYASLSFGQTVTGNNEGSASLYQYFAATAVILILVSLLPPNRGDSWLSFKSRSD